MDADVDDLMRRKSNATHYLCQRLPRHVFHDDNGLVTVIYHIVDDSNVGMIQNGGRTRLAKELVSYLRGREA